MGRTATSGKTIKEGARCRKKQARECAKIRGGRGKKLSDRSAEREQQGLNATGAEGQPQAKERQEVKAGRLNYLPKQTC